MSTVEMREAGAKNQDNEAQEILLDSQWAQDFSEAMAYAHGYQVDIALQSSLETSQTRLSLTDQKITVHISKELVEQAEERDQLDFLGFNILHELGHVRRFQYEAPSEVITPKDAYFQNIVEDIAINFEVARQTRFFADLTKKAYDRYLFPQERRAEMAKEPKHKQFMESLLLLSMTTQSHRGLQSPEQLVSSLENIGFNNFDETIVDRLAQVVNFSAGQSSYNLLEQLRAHGDDLAYASQITRHIRIMYDELFEEDKQKQAEKPTDSSDGSGESVNEQFDYSNTAGCKHNEQHGPNKEQFGNGKADNESNQEGGQDGDQNSESFNPRLEEIGKQIGNQIAEVIENTEALNRYNEKPNQLSEEQLARLRQELGLDESDFQGFLETVNKYRSEISIVTELILQLKRERQDNFLAPSHEISARGHRIHIGKLLDYVAGSKSDPKPDIWKTPAFKEKVEYDFDGADFYFLCDTSGSMAGSKAEAAAESAVVLSQGIQDASFEAFDDIPPIRIQVQAFGSGDEMLCQLTDSPSNKNLGQMFSALRRSSSKSTEVSGALQKINPDKSRLSVVLVLSDGQFHDESAALAEGKRLENEGAVLVQCIFGGANVSKLSSSAKRMDIAGARDLPTYIFGIMPELLQVLRSTHHA